VLTVLAAIALATVPGGLLALSLPPGRYRWAAWASAPALSLGLTAVAMGWLPRLGLPDGAVAVLVAELVLAAGAVLAARVLPRVRRSRRGRSDAGAGRAAPAVGTRPPALDLVCLAVPAVLAVGLGWLLLGRFAEPPGWDGMNHALLTRNILETGSTAVSSVCTSGFPHPVVSCSFYPLAADVSWAQATELTGGRVGLAMTAWAAYVVPVFLVATVYGCVRALGGPAPVAGAAATATTVVGPLWTSMLTGRVPEQAGPCLSVGVALMVALAMRRAHPVRLGLLAGLGAAGIVLTHSYDVLFAASLAAGLALVMRGRPSPRRVATAVGAGLVATVVAVAPFLPALLGADAERVGTRPLLLGQPARAFGYWVTDLQRYVVLGHPAPGGDPFMQRMLPVQVALWAVVVGLLASPSCLLLDRLRWARPWLFAYIAWTAVGLWTSSSDSPAAMLLSGLWYGTRERVRTMILPVYGVLAVAGACAVAIGVQRVAGAALHRAARPRTVPVRAAPVASAAAVGALLLAGTVTAVALLPDTRGPLHAAFARRTPVGASYPRTFAWLARSTAPGSVVAYDRHLEMMTWSYVDEGVRPLFGIPPLREKDRGDYAQRLRAWDWLVDNEGAPPAGCLVRHFAVQYVVVGDARVPGWPVHYNGRRLADSPRLHLVHRDGGIRVYAVNAAGRACSAGADTGSA
jgi:hypothetical protein